MSNSVDNIGFAGINYQWFIGQVPPNQILDKIDPDGWGDRVKVRIVGIHDKSGTVTPDEQLPWAIVERPTSQGNSSRGSTGLTGGEWVRGYFLDPFNQVPVITAILARGTYENNISLEEAKQKKSTGFKNITRYNSFSAHSGQVLGGDKPKEPAQPTKEDFEKAKDAMKTPIDPTQLQETIIANYSAQERAEDKLLLRSLLKGEFGSGPNINQQIRNLEIKLYGLPISGTLVRGA